MGAKHSVAATPAIMGLPLFSVTARGLANDWHMLRYRVASEWVEVFSTSLVDLQALRVVVVDAFKSPSDIYTLSSDGSVFMLEEYHDEDA